MSGESSLDVIKRPITDVTLKGDFKKGVGPPFCKTGDRGFKKSTALVLVWDSGFMNHGKSGL
jgi:hypothetical protein